MSLKLPSFKIELGPFLNRFGSKMSRSATKHRCQVLQTSEYKLNLHYEIQKCNYRKNVGNWFKNAEHLCT